MTRMRHEYRRGRRLDAERSTDLRDAAVPADGLRERETGPPTAGVRILPAIWRVLSYALFLLALVVGLVSIVVPKATGAVPLTVLSNSMAPAMPVGSLSVVRPTMGTTADPAALEPEEIRKVNEVSGIHVGDIITFQPDKEAETLVSHRVIDMKTSTDGSRTFTTQGDNNAKPDDPVEDYMVRGVVWYHIPWLGHVNDALNGDNRMLYVIAIAGVGYLWALKLWFQPSRRDADGNDDGEPETLTFGSQPVSEGTVEPAVSTATQKVEHSMLPRCRGRHLA